MTLSERLTLACYFLPSHPLFHWFTGLRYYFITGFPASAKVRENRGFFIWKVRESQGIRCLIDWIFMDQAGSRDFLVRPIVIIKMESYCLFEWSYSSHLYKLIYAINSGNVLDRVVIVTTDPSLHWVDHHIQTITLRWVLRWPLNVWQTPARLNHIICSVLTIKSMIDRDGATCRNNNHFERPAILNAPWDEHSTMFSKSVAELCSYRRARTNTQTRRQTNGRYQTYYFPCFAVDKYNFRNLFLNVQTILSPAWEAVAPD